MMRIRVSAVKNSKIIRKWSILVGDQKIPEFFGSLLMSSS